jgi:putative glutamine amidotransferase
MALGSRYPPAIDAAGGVPIVVPPLDMRCVEPLVSRVAGVCLSGGRDLNPRATANEGTR